MKRLTFLLIVPILFGWSGPIYGQNAVDSLSVVQPDAGIPSDTTLIEISSDTTLIGKSDTTSVATSPANFSSSDAIFIDAADTLPKGIFVLDSVTGSQRKLSEGFFIRRSEEILCDERGRFPIVIQDVPGDSVTDQILMSFDFFLYDLLGKKFLRKTYFSGNMEIFVYELRKSAYSEDIISFIRSQNGLLPNIHGLLIAHEQVSEKLPKQVYIMGLDDKDNLYKGHQARYWAPIIQGTSPGNWDIELADFDGKWPEGSYFLFF